MVLAKSLLHYHLTQLRQSPATGIFLTSGWAAAVLLTFVPGQLIANNLASLNALFTYLPWVMAILIPTLTMPVASEGRRGVTERLLTLPHAPTQRLFSRFTVTWALLGIWILGFWPLIATLYYLGSPDLGPILTGLLGSFFLAAPMLAISLTLCLRSKSGVGGLLASLAACLLLLLLGTPTATGWFAAVPGLGWLPATAHLTLLGAYQPFTQGLLNLSSILLFVGLTLLFLSLANAKPRTFLRITQHETRITLLAAFLLLLAVLPQLNFIQLDTTSGQLHTPSPSTVTALRSLSPPVTFTLHLSENNPDVPPAVHAYAHTLTNLLLSLRASAPGKVHVKVSNADASTAAAITALQAGASEQSLPTGTTYFAALTARVASTTTVIPVLNPARQAVQEYDVMALLNHAVRTTQPIITVLESQSDTQPDWQKALQPDFTLNLATTNSGITEIPSATSVLILPDDAPLPEPTRKAVRTYLSHGGNVLLAADAFTRTPRPTGTPSEARLSSLLPEWGVELISNTVIADPTQATLATQPGAGATTYPYWLQLTSKNLEADYPFTAGISKLFLPETGAFTISTTTANPLSINPIVTSSPQARTVSLTMFQNTPAELANTNLPPASGAQTLALMLNGAFTEDASKPATLIAFADSDWLSDTSLNQSPDNLIFLENILNYLSGQPNLTALRAKGASPRPLTRIESMANRLTQATAQTEQKIATQLYTVTQQQGADPYATAEANAKMQEEEFTLRQKLRDIRATTRHRLQMLENALLLLNLTLMPTLTGLAFLLQRRQQRRKATPNL